MVPVSVWSYKLDDISTADISTQGSDTATYPCNAVNSAATAVGLGRRRLVVMEPVSSVAARVIFDSQVSAAAILIICILRQLLHINRLVNCSINDISINDSG